MIPSADFLAAVRAACPLCAVGVTHHTNAAGSIGGADGRHPRRDLHVDKDGGLTECWAGDLWLAWEMGARRASGDARPHAGSSPAASTRVALDDRMAGT